MFARLRAVLVKRPEEAYRSRDAIASQWRELGYARAPDLRNAASQHAELVSILERAGAEVRFLPADAATGMDSVYVRDPVLVTDAGAVILRMGKAAREGEPDAAARALREWGIPILGRLDGAARAEAGDMVGLDASTLAVGRGFRTNDAGIARLAELLRPRGVEVVPIHLPYGNGPDEVLHLMSFLSPIDADLALVYRPLLPVPMFELLERRGYALVDVPAEEYASLGANVLALGPRDVVMVRGNPVTRARLETAGCRVTEFDGSDICAPGAGGPTCLTRPIRRG